jgi:hypothetical protein
MELYDDLIQQMPYLKCMESSAEITNITVNNLNKEELLAEKFSNANIEFKYEQMFANGRMTQYGRNHRQPNK